MAPRQKGRTTKAQIDKNNKSKAAVQKAKVKVAALETKLRASEEKCKAFQLEVATGKTTIKELKNKHDKICVQLKDKLECPVCLEIPRSGPVYICPNGHFVCKKCKTEACPTCRDSMGNRKSLLAVTVLENIEHKCKFVDCEDIFPVDKLEDHEKICKHRSVECPGKCNRNIALSNLMEHLGERTKCCFENRCVIEEEYYVSHYIMNIKKQGELTWKVNTFSFPDTNIAVLAWKRDNFFYFMVVMFETKNICSQYKVELEVHERESSRESSEFRFALCGNPCSIDEDKEEWKNLGLAVNLKGMEKILDKTVNSSFTVSFKITKK